MEKKTTKHTYDRRSSIRSKTIKGLLDFVSNMIIFIGLNRFEPIVRQKKRCRNLKSISRLSIIDSISVADLRAVTDWDESDRQLQQWLEAFREIFDILNQSSKIGHVPAW